MTNITTEKKYRNKQTGTVYRAVSFNGTVIAAVETVAGNRYNVHRDRLELVPSTPEPELNVEARAREIAELPSNFNVAYRQDMILRLIQQVSDQRVREASEKAEGIGQYMAASDLLTHVGYLLSHRAEGLPENTSKVIGELYNDIKGILAKNEKFMRSATPSEYLSHKEA